MVAMKEFATLEEAKKYASLDGSELSMVFQFEHMCLDQTSWQKWDVAPLPLVKLKECYRRWQQELGEEGWNSLFMNNHDLPRIVSRWGNDGQYRVESAKMLATMLHGLQGTPYIYQGEEIGMTNHHYTSIDQYRDVESLNYYRILMENGKTSEEALQILAERSRDNGRTPMQWNAGKNAGFSEADATWLPVHDDFAQVNVEAESMLATSLQIPTAWITIVSS